MPRSNETSPQKDKDGRYSTPIPKAFGDANNLDEKKLDWQKISGTAFRVEIIEKEDEDE